MLAIVYGSFEPDLNSLRQSWHDWIRLWLSFDLSTHRAAEACTHRSLLYIVPQHILNRRDEHAVQNIAHISYRSWAYLCSDPFLTLYLLFPVSRGG